MSRTTRPRRRSGRRQPPSRARLQVELLEVRNLLSGLTLTTLVQVSDPSPLAAPADSSKPRVDVNSEVEPQIAVDPRNPAHAIAIWQQDRYFSVGGARALVVSVTDNANTTDKAGATWSKPTPIPYFNATDSTSNTIDPATGQGYLRYTDPWVTIAPNGDVHASALAMTPTGPVPGHTAVLVSKSTDGGSTWSKPTILIHDDAPNGTDPADLANDKEMIVADPNNSSNVYVVWDRLNHPSDQQNFNAFHSLAGVREDMMFARTTNGGLTWDGDGYPAAVAKDPASDITNFQADEAAFGNQIVVEPAKLGGNLVDLFTHGTGSGNPAPQADQNHLGVMIGTKNKDGTLSWSKIIDGPGIEAVDVTDPDTGAPVRAGEPLVSVAVDPNNGNLYAVWADGRFSSKYSYDGIAFSMSTDGGKTWSDPIKVNQTPTDIPAANQQAFTPTVAVNSDGTVAVTYYDFRNNTDLTPRSGLPTDYFIVTASSNFTDPTSWEGNELKLTQTSFDMEKAAPTSHGVFLGDYQGLAAAGSSFYALFGQAGSGSSDPTNIWFRDPPPAPAAAQVGSDASAAPAAASAQPTASDELSGNLAFFLGATSSRTGQGQVVESAGPLSGVVHPGDLGSQQGAALLTVSNLDLAFLSAGRDGGQSLDNFFADSGDAPFSGRMEGDGAAISAD